MSWVYHVSNRAGSMTQAEMQQNVDEIYNQLTSYGWTVEAISATLGNIQYESFINPAQTEIGYPIGSLSGGYGLVQWTPASKYKNWAWANNHAIESGYWQVYALDTSPWGTEWIATPECPESYDEFKHSTADLNYLTRCFFKNYERGTENPLRYQYAGYWYNYLTGSPPPPIPPEPDPSGYKSKAKVWLFMRNRNRKF